MKIVKWVIIACLPFLFIFIIFLGGISYLSTAVSVSKIGTVMGGNGDSTCKYSIDKIKFSDSTEKVRKTVEENIAPLYVNMILGIYEVDEKNNPNINDIIKKMKVYIDKNIDIPTMTQAYRYGVDYLKYLKDNNEKHSLAMSKKYYELKYANDEKNKDKNMYNFYNDVLAKTNKDCKSLVVSGKWNVPLQKPFVISNEYGGEHRGIDVVRAYGENVYSVTDGQIINTNNTCVPNGGYLGNMCPYGGFDGSGNFVEMKVKANESKILYVYYFHLSNVFVKIGDTIKVGERIGAIGNSGNSTGTHLHLEIRDENRLTWTPNGHEINPHTLINFFEK